MHKLALYTPLLVSLLPGGELLGADKAPADALASYVAKVDPSYRWVKRRGGKLGKGEYVELTLTSQTWQGIVWKHQLFIYKPSTVDRNSHALLRIEGGRWRDELAGKVEPNEENLPPVATAIAQAAEQMKSVVAVLLHVPQQPIFNGMIEDQIIAYTFMKYFETGDVEWPLLLPMVKSAVRGMDAVQEFAGKEWQLEIKEFTLTGASKRGWTTWLTGAVDPRATALVPMVIDMLNIGSQVKLQMESFGRLSEQLRDYSRWGLELTLGTQAGKALVGMVDPYSYRDRLKQPKLIMLGTNDRYWPLDALNAYWDGLEDEKYILYVPNNGHGLSDFNRVVGTLNAFHQHVSHSKPLPKLTWKFTEDGDKLALTLQSDVAPKAVRVWTAISNSRDFRESKFISHSVSEQRGEFVYDLTLPKGQHAALFGEAEYDGDPLPFYLSTNVKIGKGS